MYKMSERGKDLMMAQVSCFDEIIVDSFAGGGGTSTGIELATGRVVTAAINHDPDAILMHQTNHPYTEHYQASVWDVDPKEVCKGRAVGLFWASPDCKHFSKAKGGKPVDKKIRGLAWIVCRWAGVVRPRVIILENVEEFQTWGPVRRGKPIKSKAGQTFHKFVGQLRDLGYELEWRELVAADYGAPTTRKRFFMIARCDGRPITWPERTHAPRDSEAVKSGKLNPWRSAAEIIDWSLPCPSIFDSKEAIKEKYGVTAQRPLRPNTMKRAICGVDKFVIKADTPFIIQVNHSGAFRGQSTEDPMQTITAKHGYGVVNPVFSPVTVTNTSNSVGSPADEPVHTVTTAGNQMLIVPTLTAIGQNGGGSRTRPIEAPVHTTVSKQESCLVAANLMQYHTEQRNEKTRGQSVEAPICTIDAANRYGLIGATICKYYGNDKHGQDISGPLHTNLSKDHQALLTANLMKLKGKNIGSTMENPCPTITAGGQHHAAVVTTIVRAQPGAELGHWSKVRELLNLHCGYSIGEDEVLLLHFGEGWYFISDIGLRMLTPRELYAANGFPPDYIIDHDYQGNEYKKNKQVARCGNAVPPPFAEALVRANFPEWCGEKISTMEQFGRMVAV